jgi:hypothetical protein
MPLKALNVKTGREGVLGYLTRILSLFSSTHVTMLTLQASSIVHTAPLLWNLIVAFLHVLC